MSENWKLGDVAMVTLAEPGFNARRGPGPSEYECWKREDYTTRHMWSEVNAVRVLSEGVAS